MIQHIKATEEGIRRHSVNIPISYNKLYSAQHDNDTINHKLNMKKYVDIGGLLQDRNLKME